MHVCHNKWSLHCPDYSIIIIDIVTRVLYQWSLLDNVLLLLYCLLNQILTAQSLDYNFVPNTRSLYHDHLPFCSERMIIHIMVLPIVLYCIFPYTCMLTVMRVLHYCCTLITLILCQLHIHLSTEKYKQSVFSRLHYAVYNNCE